MALSKWEEILLGGLATCNVGIGMSLAIRMTLQTEENICQMCQYLAMHMDEEPMEYLWKAREIAGLLDSDDTDEEY